jgi:hypothetical protein
MINLYEDLINNIMLYVSHPCADIVYGLTWARPLLLVAPQGGVRRGAKRSPG